jgi:colanic acid biosynthesis glycosyl transferase WcaI
LHNVAFIPFQPYDDLPCLLAASDVLLVPLDREKSQLSVPSKLYHYMAMGRPILGLADGGSEIATIITEADCGVCVAPDNVKNIAEVIRALKNSKDYRDTLAANGRKYAVEHFAKELILKEYEDVMQSL